VGKMTCWLQSTASSLLILSRGIFQPCVTSARSLHSFLMNATRCRVALDHQNRDANAVTLTAA